MAFLAPFLRGERTFPMLKPWASLGTATIEGRSGIKIEKLLLITGVLLAAGHVQATIIYDNGATSFDNALLSATSVPHIVADDFTLDSGATTITDVHWWGAYGSGTPTDDFTIFFFESDGGAPAVSALAEYNVGSVSRVDTGATLAGTPVPVYEYSADIAPLTLSADTTYFLSITQSSIWWYWAWSASSGGTIYLGDGSGWTVEGNDAELAFTLTNDNVAPVPEPASLSLLGMGLFGLALRRRKTTA